LEIQYGLLTNLALKDRCRIYIRDLPLDALDEKSRLDFSDAYRAEHDPEPERRREAAEQAAALAELKARLLREVPDRVHVYTARWNPDPADPYVDEKSLDDWVELVGGHLAEDAHEEITSIHWEENETAELVDFVRHRTRHWVDRPLVVDPLVAFATEPDPDAAVGSPVYQLVSGEPGAGKSTIFARLVLSLEKRRDVLVLAHAAGISRRTQRLADLLLRWISLLAEKLDVPDPVDSTADADALRDAFWSLLRRAAATRRVVLLVDALDQFAADPQVEHFGWLPREPVAGVRGVFTAVDGTPALLRVKDDARFAVRRLPDFTVEEALAMADGVRKSRGGALYQDVRETLAKVVRPDGRLAASSPLWIELAMYFLVRLRGAQYRSAADGATEEDRHYRMVEANALQLPPTVEELYDRMFQRIEDDPDVGPARTRAFAVAVALSRNGWRRSDFRGSIRSAGLLQRLAGVPWSDAAFGVLVDRFETHLKERGLLVQFDFFHRQMRTAVHRRYLQDAAAVRAANAVVRDFLADLPPTDPLRRTETMHHLIGANDAATAAEHLASLNPGPDLNAAVQSLADLLRRNHGDGIAFVRRLLGEG
ncbi:MAG: AAA family ATPase, partial [Planctomycetia bacterium]